MTIIIIKLDTYVIDTSLAQALFICCHVDGVPE